jgi:methylmalonyl-CoA epimerase
MKAVLDHVGIAVEDVARAIAFYRDALGLEIETPEDVPTEQIRAHFIPTGQSALELLEATAPASAVARFIAKRGPGLHHITLRVDDIHAVMAHLQARSVRLVDETPRPGASGSLVAFIHPSAAGGVLVELKQAGRPPFDARAKRLGWGDLQLTSVNDGLFRLDGGAMFGVVPRPLWEKRAQPDDRGRVLLAMRPLVVEADWGRMIIDCGAGDKMDAKQRDIYGFDGSPRLDDALVDAGLTADVIDLVLASHLHFDHMGGGTVRRGPAILPRFAHARYVIRAAEWEDATHPHERNRASYLQDDFVPLKDAGVVDFFDGIPVPG